MHAGVCQGVRALFTGPSGTGKILTARYIASRLNLDVHRADLARRDYRRVDASFPLAGQPTGARR